MNILILSAKAGWHTDELCRALRERGHVGTVQPYEALCAQFGTSFPRAGGTPERRAPEPASRRAGEPTGPAAGLSVVRAPAALHVFDADAVLARIIPNGSLEQIIFRVNALHWIEQHGVRVMNSPRAIERCVDKFYTTALLSEAGLPVPDTVVCERAADAMEAIRSMLDRRDGGPSAEVIIKPIFGSMGHGLIRVSDAELAFRIVRPLEQMRAVFYIQQAIDHGGRDIRAFVIGGRVLGAIERSAVAGDWRSNVSRGAATRVFELPPSWEDLACRAAAAVGADYAGVDLVPGPDQRVAVLEVNGIPGWEGLQRATGTDVAGAIVDHLLATLAARPGGVPA